MDGGEERSRAARESVDNRDRSGVQTCALPICLENPMNSVKRQNDRILKEKLNRSVGAQYATGEDRKSVV